jgi:hypothetical protein
VLVREAWQFVNQRKRYDAEERNYLQQACSGLEELERRWLEYIAEADAFEIECMQCIAEDRARRRS